MRSAVTIPEQAPRPGALDASVRTSLVAIAGFAMTFATCAAVGWGPKAAVSVLVGGAIALLNLYGLARILGAFLGLRSASDANAGLWGVLAIFKVIGLFGGVWLLLGATFIAPIAMLVGWGSLPLGIALGALFTDKNDPSEPPRGNEAPPEGPAHR